MAHVAILDPEALLNTKQVVGHISKSKATL